MGTTAKTDLVVRDVTYELTTADVHSRFGKYRGLTAATVEGYERVRLALADMRATRGRIEDRRVELKADALAYGRKVDGVAKELSAAIEEIEQPLKVEKGKVDDERARAKAAQEAAEREALEAKLKAEREAVEAVARAEREAEESRLRAAREVEDNRLRDERAKLEADRATAAAEQERLAAARRAEEARIQADRQKLEAERRQFEEQRRAAEREETDRQARLRAEKEAAEKAERDRIAAEKVQAEVAARAEQARQRTEAMRPDVDKIAALAEAIEAIGMPEVADQEAKTVAELAAGDLEDVVVNLRGWVQGFRASEAA